MNNLCLPRGEIWVTNWYSRIGPVGIAWGQKTFLLLSEEMLVAGQDFQRFLRPIFLEVQRTLTGLAFRSGIKSLRFLHH